MGWGLRKIVLWAAFQLFAVTCSATTSVGSDFDQKIRGNEYLLLRPVVSEAAILDASKRRISFEGLDLSLPDEFQGPLPVRVTVDCFADAGTPKLAIDRSVYGAGSRLENLNQNGARCASYQVIAETGDQAAAGLTQAAMTPPKLAVSIHYSGPTNTSARPSVFVFNPVVGSWSEAKPFAPQTREAQRVYATLEQQRQRMIAGVIAVPDALASNDFGITPASISKGLAGVNPPAGYLSIDNVEPDSKGAYSVALPLLTRPSRGPGPSFAIRYSSGGAVGALGLGWDLTISKIDVRGPSPIYHSGFETEDYLLDGVELIALDAQGKDIPPLYKGGPILPRDPQAPHLRVFRLRNNTSGLIVRRYGDNPNSYYWEVWDPHSHITRLYGARYNLATGRPEYDGDNGVLRGAVVLGNGKSLDAIGEWGLTQEYDSQPALSGSRYFYSSNKCRSVNWNGPCSASLRLTQAQYNLAFGLTGDKIPVDGTTLVDFKWVERPEERRYTSDARLGFLRANEYWLTDISVSYQPILNRIWLASAGAGQPPTVVFSKHHFGLSDGSNPCMNYAVVLKSYSVEGNKLYDVEGAKKSPPSASNSKYLETQNFTFDYEGEKSSSSKEFCDRKWPTQDISAFGLLPPNAAQGMLGFPGSLLKDLGFGLLDKQSALGVSQTEETGGSLYGGVGLPGNPFSKETTVGFKGGVDFSKTDGASTFIDINGDGIADLVYKYQGKLRYCAGVRSPGPDHKISYPTDRCGDIEGISDFSLSSATTESASAEIYAGGSAFAGAAFNSSHNETYTYFTDVDGDGLVDVVANGQVFYNQGEERDGVRNVVRFAPNSALRPPLPGHIGKAIHDAKTPLVLVPRDLRNTISDIETRLAAASRRLRGLEYTQTTLAWEAPLDGVIEIAGQLTEGVSASERGNAGAFPEEFGPKQFEDLYAETAEYQVYIDRKYECDIWPEDRHCYDEASDPLGPHYSGVNDIQFLPTPFSRIEISKSSKNSSAKAVSCFSDIIYDGFRDPTVPYEYNFSSKAFGPECRVSDAQPTRIHVNAGDVIYLTYSVHPHLRAWVAPKETVNYVSVDGDKLFDEFDPSSSTVKDLNCKWKEQTQTNGNNDCLLAMQSRYSYYLTTGTIASAPTDIVELPAGTQRVFGGRFQLPVDITTDYQVFFDIVAQKKPALSPGDLNPPPSNALPASELPRLFRQDISLACIGQIGTCIVNVSPTCDSADPNCKTFFDDKSMPFVLAGRLTVLHRGIGIELPVRNISSRLSALTWLVPPYVKSIVTDPTSPLMPKPLPGNTGIVTYLPIAMGEPDIDYFRVEKATFYNPDEDLKEGDPPSLTIKFQDVLDWEKKNIELARLRQKLHLCRFADEIVEFLKQGFSSEAEPFANDYVSYWEKKTSDLEARKHLDKQGCADAESQIANFKFIPGQRPENITENGLRLYTVLRDLPYAQQVTSAENSPRTGFAQLGARRGVAG